MSLFLYYFLQKHTYKKRKKNKSFGNTGMPLAMHMELIKKKKGWAALKTIIGTLCCTWQLTTTLFSRSTDLQGASSSPWTPLQSAVEWRVGVSWQGSQVLVESRGGRLTCGRSLVESVCVPRQPR